MPTTCPYLQEGRCSIVLQRTGIEWIAHPRACEACSKQTPPQGWNKATMGLCIAALHKAKDPEFEKKAKALLAELYWHPTTTIKSVSLPRRVSNYAKAIAKWTAAGQPKRTDAEVESILMLCRACSHFNGESCKVCGCRVNASQAGVANKARMRTEFCPKLKW